MTMRWPNLSNPNRNPPPNGPTAGILGPDLVYRSCRRGSESKLHFRSKLESWKPWFSHEFRQLGCPVPCCILRRARSSPDASGPHDAFGSLTLRHRDPVFPFRRRGRRFSLLRSIAPRGGGHSLLSTRFQLTFRPQKRNWSVRPRPFSQSSRRGRETEKCEAARSVQ